MSTAIVSSLAIKIMKLSPETMKKNIRWINDKLEIDAEMAKKTLAMRNPYWFSDETDVIMATTSALPDKSRIITIYISTSSFDKMLLSGLKKFNFDLGGFSTVAYLNISPPVCLKCMAFGHFFNSCDKPTKCKFCAGGHPSGECKTPPPPVCFRCKAANKEDKSLGLCTKHHAISHLCPFMQEQEDITWFRKREQASARLNNA